MISLNTGFLFGTSGALSYEDTYQLTDSHRVKFFCPAKTRLISGALASPISYSVQSNWESWLSNSTGGIGGGAYKIVDTIDKLSQAFTGNSINQPWLGRKLWRGTTPLSFQFDVKFVSTGDALSQVWKPALGLTSFLYPRATGDTSDRKGLFSAFNLYKVPGPSFFDNASDSSSTDTQNKDVYTKHQGDHVEVYLGKHISFKSCYLEDLKVTFSPSLDANGVPISAVCSVKITAQDSSFVKANGEFLDTIGTIGDADISLVNVAKLWRGA